MEETERKRIQALYEKAIDAMRRYHSDEEYLSADVSRKPISLKVLGSFVRTLQCQINNYECCIDDAERAKIGMELIRWCQGLSVYDSIEEVEDVDA